MEQSTSIAAFVPFARSASYTPPGEGGEAVTVSAIIDTGVEYWETGGYSQILKRRDEATFRLDQVRPVRGAVLVSGGVSYVVGEVVEEDGILITMTIRSQPLGGGQLQAGLQSDLG